MSEQQVRSVAQGAFDAIMLDAWPSNAGMVDLCISDIGDSSLQREQKRYEAWYYAVRRGGATAADIDATIGFGIPDGKHVERIEAFMKRFNLNAVGIVWRSSYDAMADGFDDEGEDDED